MHPPSLPFGLFFSLISLRLLLFFFKKYNYSYLSSLAFRKKIWQTVLNALSTERKRRRRKLFFLSPCRIYYADRMWWKKTTPPDTYVKSELQNVCGWHLNFSLPAQTVTESEDGLVNVVSVCIGDAKQQIQNSKPKRNDKNALQGEQKLFWKLKSTIPRTIFQLKPETGHRLVN